MTDEGERPAADMAAEIMSADRPSAPARDGARNSTRGDYLVRAALVIAVVAFILAPVIVVILTHPE
jgi:hypothetical protein